MTAYPGSCSSWPSAVGVLRERVARSMWADLMLITSPRRPHTLLVGPEGLTASIVDAWREDFLEPVRMYDCAASPDLTQEAGTMILWHVESLNVRGQDQLMARLDSSHGSVQIISVARCSPFARVQYGCFPDALYRRLSVVYICVDDPTADR